jgi:hypothetical protein
MSAVPSYISAANQWGDDEAPMCCTAVVDICGLACDLLRDAGAASGVALSTSSQGQAQTVEWSNGSEGPDLRQLGHVVRKKIDEDRSGWK